MSRVRRNVQGFTWEKTDRESNGQPIWKLIWPVKCSFVLKDYGPSLLGPDHPFRGICLVSGGPFSSAGRYETMEEAMVGVVPYLTMTLNKEARDTRALLRRLQAQQLRARKAKRHATR